MEDYIEEGFEYESSDIVSPTPTPEPDILQSEENIDDSEIIEEDSFSYPSDVSGELSQSGDIEEGIEAGEEDPVEEPVEEPAETPDEIEPQEIVQNDENVDSLRSGSETAASQNPDYSQQFAQIIADLEDLQGDTNLEYINENITAINDNLETLNSNLVNLSNNQNFQSRIEVGLLVAIWASLIIYIAFSKIF